MPFQNPNPFLAATGKLAACLLLAACCFPAARATVVGPEPPPLHTANLAWNPSQGLVQNYRLFVGTESQRYTRFYDTGATPGMTVDELEQGKTYYFAVRAMGSDGIESDLSDELVVTVTPPSLPVAPSMATAESGTRSLQWSYPVEGLGSNPEFIVQSSPDLVTWTDSGVVSAADAVSQDGQMATFRWTVSTAGPGAMFYRLTARNLAGDAAVP